LAISNGKSHSLLLLLARKYVLVSLGRLFFSGQPWSIGSSHFYIIPPVQYHPLLPATTPDTGLRDIPWKDARSLLFFYVQIFFTELYTHTSSNLYYPAFRHQNIYVRRYITRVGGKDCGQKARLADGGRIRLTYPIGIRIERRPMRDIYYYIHRNLLHITNV
jgi:hypothetical protein